MTVTGAPGKKNPKMPKVMSELVGERRPASARIALTVSPTVNMPKGMLRMKDMLRMNIT
jgi:hypothetical protein